MVKAFSGYPSSFMKEKEPYTKEWAKTNRSTCLRP